MWSATTPSPRGAAGQPEPGVLEHLLVCPIGVVQPVLAIVVTRSLESRIVGRHLVQVVEAAHELEFVSAVAGPGHRCEFGKQCPSRHRGDRHGLRVGAFSRVSSRMCQRQWTGGTRPRCARSADLLDCLTGWTMGYGARVRAGPVHRPLPIRGEAGRWPRRRQQRRRRQPP